MLRSQWKKTVVSIWAGTTGELDQVPVEDVARFESEFHAFLDKSKANIVQTIKDSRDLSDETVANLKAAIADFKQQFMKSDGKPLIGNESVEALAEEDVEQAQIKVQKRG